MNLQIAIVEDEKPQREFLRTQIESWYKNTEYIVQITECQNAEEFSFKYMETLPFSMVFMDICMGDMNGFELAQEIRKRDKDIQLVFLTGVKDYVFEGYKLGILRYLIKPLVKEELYSLLADCTELLIKKQQDYFCFPYMGENRRLSFSKIIWLQVEGHYIRMKSNEEEFQWKGSLAQMKDLLSGKEFVRLNRSTIVNMQYVNRITKEICYLESGEEMPISRNEYAKVNQAFMSYYM